MMSWDQFEHSPNPTCPMCQRLIAADDAQRRRQQEIEGPPTPKSIARAKADRDSERRLIAEQADIIIGEDGTARLRPTRTDVDRTYRELASDVDRLMAGGVGDPRDRDEVSRAVERLRNHVRAFFGDRGVE